MVLPTDIKVKLGSKTNMSQDPKARRGRSTSRKPRGRSGSTSRHQSRRTAGSRLTVEVPQPNPEQDEQYDLTSVFSDSQNNRRGSHTPSYSIDPWEVVVTPPTSPIHNDNNNNNRNESMSHGSCSNSENSQGLPRVVVARTSSLDSRDGEESVDDSNRQDDHHHRNGYDPDDEQENGRRRQYTNNHHEDNNDRLLLEGEEDVHGVPRTSHPANRFLVPHDIHPNMEQREEDIAQLRLLAGKLNADWRGQDFMAPALARRIRDFQFAQEKRRKKYGDERPFGILGLYDHLASIRVDVEWAEDAAWRRANGESYLSWADFDASKKKGVNRPFFTYLLLAICTLVMIASIAMNGWSFEPLDENPMIGPSAETLLKMGAKDSYLIVYEDDVWRLLSAAILHAGLVHYFINMLALWFVGAAIETSHGFVAATILFTIPAIGGTILSAIFLPEYITVGASGGIFGLIGACLSDIIMNWKLLFHDFVTENGKRQSHAMVVVFLLLDIFLNCIIGLTPYVDNFTHLGGMAYGLLCGLSTMERLPTSFFGMEEGCWSQAKQLFIRFFGLIVSIVTIIITLVILLEGDGETTPCPKCTWLSCVPFPPWEDQASKWWYCDDCGRVKAEIVYGTDPHLQLICPDGSTTRVDLDTEEEPDRDKLEANLPSYCRDYCHDIDRTRLLWEL